MLTWLVAFVLDHSWLAIASTFVLGAIVGSFLNVCIYRLPAGRSIFWPPSSCASCGQRIRWYDNIPLVSYWVLRGRCRHCGARFSMRYFWLELLTAVLFAATFWWVVHRDGHRFTHQPNGRLFSRTELLGLEGLETGQRLRVLQEKLVLRLIRVWFYDMVFMALLLVAMFTDIDTMTIPLPLTLSGTALGCLAGMLVAWPWPFEPEMPKLSPWEMQLIAYGGWARGAEILSVPLGAQLWPFWYPPVDWLPPGSWRLGLANALFGAVFGSVLMRLIRLVFSWAFRKEALGLGDADLMMLIGAFLGWQAVLATLVAGVFLALGYGVFLLVTARGRELPFGPFLAGGGWITLWGAPWILRPLQGAFFDLPLLLLLSVAFALLTLLLAMSIRILALILAAE